MEALLQFALPLLAQVRRAEHGQALDLATVEQLAGDQRAFDGLADTDVVGDQQAHGVLLQRHQQRHELVGARLDGDVAEAAERAGTGAQLELQRIEQQLAGGMVARLVARRPREGGRPHGLALQRQIDQRFVLFATAERAQVQGLGVGLGQDDPFAAAGRDEAAGVKLGGRCVHVLLFFAAPNRSALVAKMSGHVRVSLGKRTTT